MNTKISGMINGFDFEIVQDFATLDEINTFTQELKKHGEFLPKPRFSKGDDKPFSPFRGVIVKTEGTKTKNGKDMFIAYVKPDVAEGEQQKEDVAVKYMPPEKTWRSGDLVYIDKNEKGWLELHEQAGEPPF